MPGMRVAVSGTGLSPFGRLSGGMVCCSTSAMGNDSILRHRPAGTHPHACFDAGRRIAPPGSGRFDQAMMNGVQGKLKPIRNAKLIEYVVQMIFDGLFADKEFLADFPVSKALCDELYDFLLAVAEQRLFAPLARFRRFLEGVNHFRGHAVIEPNFAFVHLTNAF